MAQLKKDPRTRKKKMSLFLEKLERVANVSQACKSTRIPRRTIYNWIDTDEIFKKDYERSVQIAIDVLEDEAKRRAFAGNKEPVYQGGNRVGTVTKYSDTLLIFLLKSLKPTTYRDVVRNEHAAPGGGPIETKATVVVSNVDYEKLPTSALEAIIAARIKTHD